MSRILPQGEVKIGIDDFPITLLGEIDEIKLHNPGERANKKGKMCVIQQG